MNGPAVKLGAVMRAGGAGYVVKSKDPKTPVGSYVGGLVGIQEYCIAKPNDAKDIFSSVKGRYLYYIPEISYWHFEPPFRVCFSC